MSLYESVLRPIAFRMDPEKVHEMGLGMIAKGVVRVAPCADPRFEQTLFGVKFTNPLGLAAGFDKNGIALNHWEKLAFGYIEAGTVTLHAQPGNPKPRLFRFPSDKAIINRMGFNNEGAASFAARVEGAEPHIPVGINLGKSKITPIEDAAKDYQGSFRLLHRFGDYFVVNVSSPNTPGLRTLQEKGPLLEILSALREVDADKPLLVKMAPDLEMAALDDLIEVAHEAKLTGLIATNTTISRETLSYDPKQDGGLSGMPLKNKANQFLDHLAKSCDPSMVLIGVGGIFTGKDLYEKISLGADLCQIYTGFVYGGPQSVPTILAEFKALLDQNGVKSLAELRSSHRR